MSEEKKVSIILCFYNEEKYLAKAIDSVLAQTYSNFELILVNDGSTDGSDAIVKSYQDERIKYISYEINRHQAYARNKGLELATGDYIGFFDGDDIMLSDKLKKQVEFLNKNKHIMLAGGGYAYMDAEGSVFGKIIEPVCKNDLEIRAYMLFGNCFCTGGVLFRRSIVEQYHLHLDESNRASEDYDFWMEMLPYGKVANLDDCLYYYRTNHGSKSSAVVESDEKAYDNEVMKILERAWKRRGFFLDSSSLTFLYFHLFKQKRAWKLTDIIQGCRTYKKIKQQLKKLGLKEEGWILKYYKQQWKRTYHTYWLINSIIRKRV